MKQIAFWTYDQYPYTLFGEIIGEECKTDYPGKGYFQIKEYGGGYFKPFLVLPENEAKPIIERLEYLKISYRTQQENLRRDFNILLENALPKHPNFVKKG